MQAIFLIVIAACIAAGFAADLDWLMEHRKVRMLVNIHGREKARKILLATNICLVIVGCIWLYWIS